jgi:hypothetical protein
VNPLNIPSADKAKPPALKLEKEKTKTLQIKPYGTGDKPDLADGNKKE